MRSKPVRNNARPIGKVNRDESLFGTQDAFHVPGVLVTCEQPVPHGAYVRFVGPKTVVLCDKVNHQAVADPWFSSGAGFLPGTGFWALIRPGLVTSMTHVFETNQLFGGNDD